MAAIIDRRRRATRVIVAGWSLFATPVLADTDFDPFVLVSETYTSNIALAPPELAEEEWATTLSPGFGLASLGTRHDFSMSYQAQGIFYANESDRNETFHQADIISNLELWPERFGLDFLAAYGQTIADPTQPIPFSNVSTTANRLDFGTANANPYLTFNIGQSTMMRFDYAIGEVNYQDSPQNVGIDDVRREIGSFVVGSDEDQRFEWQLAYSKQRAEFELFPEFRYERATAEVGLPIGGRFSFVAVGGKETDVPVARTTGGLDSRFWQAGVRWESPDRAAIELRAGDRFFGDTYFASWMHNSDRLSMVLEYREDPTTLGLEQLGRPVINLLPGDTSFGTGLGQQTQEIYINRQLTGRLAYTRSRIDAIVTIRDVEREYIETGGTEHDQQFDMDWFWRFGSRSTLGFGFFYLDIGFRRGPAEDNLYQLSARLDRQTGSRARLSFVLRRERRESKPASPLEYEENAAIIEYVIGNAPDLRRF